MPWDVAAPESAALHQFSEWAADASPSKPPPACTVPLLEEQPVMVHRTMKSRVKASPVSAFLCFFNAAMLACVTNSTNQRGVLRASAAGQPAADWQPVSEATMLSYLGAHMAMDIDVRPHFEHYWYTGTNSVLPRSGVCAAGDGRVQQRSFRCCCSLSHMWETPTPLLCAAIADFWSRNRYEAVTAALSLADALSSAHDRTAPQHRKDFKLAGFVALLSTALRKVWVRGTPPNGSAPPVPPPSLPPPLSRKSTPSLPMPAPPRCPVAVAAFTATPTPSGAARAASNTFATTSASGRCTPPGGSRCHARADIWSPLAVGHTATVLSNEGGGGGVQGQRRHQRSQEGWSRQVQAGGRRRRLAVRRTLAPPQSATCAATAALIWYV